MKKILAKYHLVEAGRTERYYNEMFKKLVEQDDSNFDVTHVKNSIRQVVKALERQDRIGWALHLFRERIKHEPEIIKMRGLKAAGVITKPGSQRSLHRGTQ